MRRIAVAVILVLAGVVWPAASGVARNPATTQAAAAGSLQADFNNDGFADLAVTVPFEDVGTIPDAGAVHVLYGAPTGLAAAGGQLLTQDSPGVPGVAEVGDDFGSALATGDFDDDGFADLAVGVDGEDLGGATTAGAVNVLYGTAGGLTGVGSQVFTQDSPGVPGVAELGDVFGVALAAGDVDNDGFDDLVVGVPGEDLGGVEFGGAVHVLGGAGGGLTGTGSQLFTQDSPGVPGSTELDDVFGSALAAGDFDNNGFTDLAVGVPGENLGAVEAGAANVLLAAGGGLTGAGGQLFTQDSPGVPGVAEEDFFAEGLTAADFDDDGFADLAVGVPGEDVGAVMEAGAANIAYGAAGGLTATGSQLFTQDTPGVPDTAEGNDGFALALAASGPQRARGRA